MTPLYCNHANEVPNICSCSDDCYCKQNSCLKIKLPDISSDVARAERIVDVYADNLSQTRFGSLEQSIALALAAVRQEEREACATIADRWAASTTPCDDHSDNPCCHVRTGRAIADAIRERT